MREVVFDLETTGFDYNLGNRIFEIGCVELHNQRPTGKTKQWYIDPETYFEQGATRITDFVWADLRGCPTADQVLPEFLEFIGDDPIVAHNGRKFDVDFLNFELRRAGLPEITNQVVDTMEIAREKYPGEGSSLDALCKKFKIDTSGRKYHGALLDSFLLADVYLQLIGPNYDLGIDTTQPNDRARTSGGASAERTDAVAGFADKENAASQRQVQPWPARPIGVATAEEVKAHADWVSDKIKSPLWDRHR